MDNLNLRCGDVLVKLDAEGDRLSFERGGTRLPWELDVGGTGRLTVRGKKPGAAGKTHPVRLADLSLRRLCAARLQWVGEVGGAGVALELELGVDGLVFSVSPLGTGGSEIVAATWPGELRMKGDRREAVWSDCHQGALFRADGKPWDTTLQWRNASMRVFGFTVDGHTLAVIVDTPFDAEAKLADDGVSQMTSTLEFTPSLGRLGYPRRVRLLPLAETGCTAVANAFRDYARKNRLWKSFAERVDENPEVEKLRGAFVACAGYWWDDSADQVTAMKTLREYGFQRAWFFSPRLCAFGDDWNVLGVDPNHMTDQQLREIQSLGYLCAPFLQVEEAGSSVGREKFATDAKGERVLRWQIGREKYWEIAKWRVPAMLPMLDDRLVECNGIHFDTLTAMPLVENHGERSYDCTGDARLRMEIADYYRRRGKVICAESMRDWGILHCDLSTAKTFAPVRTRDGRVWTVPLTDLVYHDSTPRSHWEHHSYDDNRGVRDLIHRAYHPFGMELMDLLTASPPVLFPEGMLYYYELKDTTRPDGTPDVEVDWTRPHLYRKRLTDPETQEALPKALRVCRLNERHGVARMLSHRFVDPGSPFVQESEFDTGLHVVVNFGDEPYTLEGGRTVAARGSLVDG